MAKIDLDAHLLELWERERERCAADPVYWAFKYGVTKDEHDKRNPVKLIPQHEYLKYVLDRWHTGEKIQFVAKSRQLMVSWLLALYSVWTAKFAPHRMVLFQSKKFEDACLMVAKKYPDQARCTFIEKHQPAFLRGCLGSKGEWLPMKLDDCMTEGRLVYPNGSAIEAIPQGPAQIEGRVPSLFCNDEASLQEEWKAGHAAAMPCVTGVTDDETAHYITVATMRLPSSYGEEIAGAGFCDPNGIMRGVGEFKSLTGVPTLRVHYSADPGKDTETEAGRKWLERALRGYGGMDDPNWLAHMEIDPSVRFGRPVFPYWEEIRRRVVIEPLPIELVGGWSLSSGLDWGAQNHAVWLVFANDGDGNRYLVHEISVPGNTVGGIYGFCGLMKAYPLFERLNGRIQADPSLWNVDQNRHGGMVSKAQLFSEQGVFMQPAKTKGQEADDIFVNRMHGYYWAGAGTDDFEPKFFISADAKETLKAWPALRYEEWGTAMRDERSLKEKIRNKDTDQFDAAKYCEVSVQDPGARQAAAPVGSFMYLRNLILRANSAGKHARS